MNNRQHKNNYRIIRIDDTCKDEFSGHGKKVILKTFYAEDDAAALKYLKDYKKIANKEYTYYFDDNKEDLFEKWRKKNKMKAWYSKVWDAISFSFCNWFFYKPRDLYYWMKDVVHWLRTKHNRDEYWSLDYHVLDDIVFNLEILKAHIHGVAQPFIELAIKERNKDDPNFDLDAYLKKTNYGGTKEDVDLAIELMKREFDNQILNIRLYNYYSSYGVVSDNDEAMKKIAEQYEKTLPYLPGRYKSFDYDKLNAMIEEQWNKICDWNKKHLRMCWD